MKRCCGNHGVYPNKMYAMPMEVNHPVCPEVPHHCGHHHQMPTPMPMPMQEMPMQEMPAPMPMPMPELPVHHMPAPMPTQHHLQGTVTQVVEPTHHCPTEYHHYNKVEHIVPVVVENIHHYHTQHEYIICKEEKTEVCEHTYGLECEKDICELVNNCHKDCKWY